MNIDNGMNVDDDHSYRVFLLTCSLSLLGIAVFSYLTFYFLKNAGVLARIK